MDESIPTHEVSLEEAIAIAILFQKNGQLEDAEKIYRRILGVIPDHPDVLHYAGVLAHQQGRSDEAIALIARSLELAPDHADGYSNLGIIFKAQGRLDEAVAAYQRAIELNPDHANAHSNLGVLLKAQGRFDEAEASYRAAVRINPEHIDAYHNLGILLASQKRSKEAVECYCRVITLNPKHSEARRLLALAHCTLGQIGKAIEIFERWLEEEPDNPIARHMLAACSHRDVPSRAADAFVEKTFDAFAGSFDSKLAKLGYRAPALVAAMLDDCGIAPARTLDVLDAGCGTGLCGPLVAPYARRLVGVDLSAGMLAQAQEKQVYDEIVKGELTAYLRACDRAFDVIVSADTLVYFGALDDVVAAAADALRPGGLLIFSVEESGDADGTGYRLQTHGRYTHARGYVTQVVEAAGMRCEIVAAELRFEAGVAVAGMVVRATRPAALPAKTRVSEGAPAVPVPGELHA